MKPGGRWNGIRLDTVDAGSSNGDGNNGAILQCLRALTAPARALSAF
jgi:hypothetical protein